MTAGILLKVSLTIHILVKTRHTDINLMVTDSVAAKMSDLKAFLSIINFVFELDPVLCSFLVKSFS